MNIARLVPAAVADEERREKLELPFQDGVSNDSFFALHHASPLIETPAAFLRA